MKKTSLNWSVIYISYFHTSGLHKLNRHVKQLQLYFFPNINTNKMLIAILAMVTPSKILIQTQEEIKAVLQCSNFTSLCRPYMYVCTDSGVSLKAWVNRIACGYQKNKLFFSEFTVFYLVSPSPFLIECSGEEILHLSCPTAMFSNIAWHIVDTQ